MPLFAASQAHSTKLQRGALLALLLLFLLVLLRTAWICDDAYISLRTVDNFVEGHGLRWNVAERVQTFTHPLWVLLLSGLYALTRELYLTTILLSVCLSWTAVALMAGALPRSFLAGISALLLLLLSPAFVDFSTGGLENPLSHLLLVLFLWAYGKDGRWRPLLIGLIAGLALTTRLDHLWIYLPALALELHRSRDRRTLGMLALGLSPLIAWTLFSLLYYGFPIPNSAVAKLNSGLARGVLLGQGLRYLWDALRYDTLTALAIAWGLIMGLRSSNRQSQALALGLLLYLLYLLNVGGDFMRGRFLALPLLLAVALMLRQDLFLNGRARLALPGIVVVLGFLVPSPTLLSGSDYGGDITQADIRASRGITDERGYYFQRYGLLNGKPRLEKLGADMALLHRRQAKLDIRLMEVATAGENAFSTGPGVFVVDAFGLGDALLARLDMREEPDWRIGHYARNKPAGYLLAALTGVNHIEDPDIGEYYAKLRLLTRGPLLDRRRLREILRMNLGRYEHLVDGNGDYPVAGIDDYIALAEKIPDLGNARILWDVSRHFIANGELARAEPFLARLLALRVAYSEQAFGLVTAGIRAGREDEAESLLDWYTEFPELRGQALYLLSGIYGKQGRREEGMEALQEAARLGHAPSREFLSHLGVDWRR